MATYTHQGAATVAFGIEFRSKLEAEWAYWLTEQNIKWDYVDSPWHDFRIGDGYMPFEVKPQSIEFLRDALDRIPASDESLFVIGCGSPTKSVPVIVLGAYIGDGWKVLWKINSRNMAAIDVVWRSCCGFMDGACAYRDGWFHAFNWRDVPMSDGYCDESRVSPDCRPLLDILREIRRYASFVRSDFSI